MKVREKSIKVLVHSLLPGFLLIPILLSCTGNQGGNSVMKGHFRQSVIETGEIQAVNSSTLTMPRINSIYGYNFKIVSLAEHGKNVHKGEPVITVDPSSVQKYIIEKRESLENEIASSNKLRAQLNNNFQDLKAQLRNEQASFDIKRLQLDKAAFESESRRRVLELEFQQAEIRLSKLRRRLELRPKIDSLDYRIQRIKIIQRENELKVAEETLQQMVVYSPLEGVFVVDRNPRTGQAIKVGDEVYLGYVVARIPDLTSMKVNGTVAENDIRDIKPGLNVIVRLDALPNVPFYGKLTSVSRVCIQQDNQKKVFQTEVLITDTDARLKPGMTVRCEYITYEGDNEIYVPNNYILEEDRHYYCYVKQRRKITKTEIKPGPSNNMYTVVSGNLKPGQKLILPDKVVTR